MTRQRRLTPPSVPTHFPAAKDAGEQERYDVLTGHWAVRDIGSRAIPNLRWVWQEPVTADELAAREHDVRLEYLVQRDRVLRRLWHVAYGVLLGIIGLCGPALVESVFAALGAESGDPVMSRSIFWIMWAVGTLGLSIAAFTGVGIAMRLALERGSWAHERRVLASTTIVVSEAERAEIAERQTARPSHGTKP